MDSMALLQELCSDDVLDGKKATSSSQCNNPDDRLSLEYVRTLLYPAPILLPDFMLPIMPSCNNSSPILLPALIPDTYYVSR